MYESAMNYRNLMRIALSFFVVLLLSAFLHAGPQTYTHVIAAETSYYLHGPQQAMPPQGKFRPGTKVIIIQDMGSYVRVKSEDGIEAAVSAGSLKKVR